MAKNKVRTLDFYGFDGDSTMLRNSDYFPISDVKEIENMKYIKIESKNESSDTETNN